MRKPTTIEHLYINFDSFFASVEQQCDKRLRDRPVGIVPFAGTDRTSVIASSKEAKAFGVQNIMRISEAKALCPGLILVPQNSDLYRRAHNALLCEIETVIPIDTIKSIDELVCILDECQRRDPEGLAREIKKTIAENIGPYITGSIGFAANRQLAKMACKMGKDASKKAGQYGNAVTIWYPYMMPEPLFQVKLEDIPGVGRSMAQRLYNNNIYTTEQLYNLRPKHMRQIWHSVIGERLWTALHGYAVQSQKTKRSMFGHAHILQPENRNIKNAHKISRVLLVKASRRLRRAKYFSCRLWLWLEIRGGSWSRTIKMPPVNDDHAILSAHTILWDHIKIELTCTTTIFRIRVNLLDLREINNEQLDIFNSSDVIRQKWKKINSIMDMLNTKYSRTILHIGEWSPPTGNHIGDKISHTYLPSAEDFF